MSPLRIGKGLSEKYEEVSYVRVGEWGVGVVFRKDVEVNISKIVGYMDIDLSTNIRHLKEMVDIL